jgi:hypothetical protein
MNPTRIVVWTCTLAVAGLAVGLALERQACLKLDAENNILRSQLRKMGELTAENQRLSNLLQTNPGPAQAIGSSNTNAAPGGDQAELARLRSEIERFSQRSNQVESLRADTLATSAALKEAHDAHRNSRTTSHNNAAPGSSAFEVLSASYATASTNLDVAAELNDRVHNGSLKTVAGNNVAGDPDPGHVKSLTVVYRSGGTLMTNQFRENDIVILPPP